MAIVYKATNLVNGKCYVGITRHTLELRKIWHKNASNTGKGIFQKAIRKYGWDAFDWEVLEKDVPIDKIYAAEVRWIALLRPQYNRTTGGAGIPGLQHTDDARKRMSDSHMGMKKPWAGETMKRPEMRERMRQRGLTPEGLARFALYQQQGPASMAREVLCVDEQKRFPSASDAARHYGVSKSMIIELCRGDGRRRSAAGHQFQYAEPTPEEAAAYEALAKKGRRYKLIQAEADEIKALLKSMPIPEIAAKFGVHKATVYDIKRGKYWTGEE